MKIPVKESVAEANNVASKFRYTILVDGNALLQIGMVDKRMNSRGESYGGVYRFLNALRNVLVKRDFSRCYVCWDGHQSGVLRWKYYKDYKQNRNKTYASYDDSGEYDKAVMERVRRMIKTSQRRRFLATGEENEDESFTRQRSILFEILDNLYVRQLVYDECEADDLIAYYCKKKPEGEKVVIVSEDRDITQLISEDVCVYLPKERIFVSTKNDVEILGIRHDNVALKKIICGDSSDNIKGVKGLGEKLFLKHFPETKERKVYLDEIFRHAKEINMERERNKQKPLMVLENLVNCVTDGIQKEQLYSINERIIDLSNPMLTNEAKADMKIWMECPLDPEERDTRSLYAILTDNTMYTLMDEHVFGEIFGAFERVIRNEKEFFKREIIEGEDEK